MFKNYFKIAGRQIARNKSFFLINIIGLAFSLACAMLIFTMIKYHLSFDNFHTDSDRIYRIVTEMHRENIAYTKNVPNPLGKYFRNDYTFAEKVARIATFASELITIERNGEPVKYMEQEGIAFTEPEFFEIFNYPMVRGNARSLISEPNTAILTESMAKKYFGDADPINKTFQVQNKFEFKVTGILKDLPVNTERQTGIYASFISLKEFDSWFYRDDSWGGISDPMQCFVRLKPGVSIAEVEAVFPAYVKKFRPTSKNVHHYKLQTLAEVHFDARYGGAMEKSNLWILSFIGLFLVITACVNYINLATSHALKRSKEVGLRKVMGSMKAQLYWQFIAETATVCFVGLIVALGLAYLALPAVNSFFNAKFAIQITDGSLLFFLFVVSVVVTFFAGSYPGFILAGFQPVVALKGKLSQQSIGGLNTRRMLIISQFAISQILVIGMFVIIKQVRYSHQADLGFDKEAVVMVPVAEDSTGKMAHVIKNQFQTISGVEKVSLCYAAPASSEAWNNSIKYDRQAEEVNFRTSIKAADEAYLPLFGLDLVAGRNLFPSDTVREFIVNEAFTRKINLTSPEDVLGKYMAANGGEYTGPIVGVVKDFHDHSFHEDISAIAITTIVEDYEKYAIKLNMADINASLEKIEQIWSQQHPDQIFSYEFVDESIARFYEAESRMLIIIQVFSALAIFIGCLGLYGMVSFMVGQKIKEIGIRKVLGSSVPQILWLFGKEFIRLILIASIIAAPIGWWLMNDWLKDFKFRIKIDPWIFLSAMLLMILIASVTISYQAIKAALTNPTTSLRSE
ncbi:MAG: FtsX-like permease family protein [Saprospiraceae bacterium]|nr:FtsX-like permease family protein [Saprospiraceae bacterium]